MSYLSAVGMEMSVDRAIVLKVCAQWGVQFKTEERTPLLCSSANITDVVGSLALAWESLVKFMSDFIQKMTFFSSCSQCDDHQSCCHPFSSWETPLSTINLLSIQTPEKPCFILPSQPNDNSTCLWEVAEKHLVPTLACNRDLGRLWWEIRA